MILWLQVEQKGHILSSFAITISIVVSNPTVNSKTYRELNGEIKARSGRRESPVIGKGDGKKRNQHILGNAVEKKMILQYRAVAPGVPTIL